MIKALARRLKPTRYIFGRRQLNPPKIEAQGGVTIVGPGKEDRVEDPYEWLERKSDEVQRRECDYADVWYGYGRQSQLVRSLYENLVSRVEVVEAGPAEVHGDYEYYVRHTAHARLPVFVRRRLDGGSEVVVLDCNEAAERLGASDVAVCSMKVSHCGRFIAYGLDHSGYEQYRLYVRDMRTGEFLVEGLDEDGATLRNLEWTREGMLLYTVVDEKSRPWRIYRRDITAKTAQVLYEEPDERFFVDVQGSKDWQYRMLISCSKTSSEVRLLAEGRESQPVLVHPRVEDTLVHVEHFAGHFQLVCAHKQADYRVFRLAEAEALERARSGRSWLEAMRPEPGTEDLDGVVDEVQVFQGHVVLYGRPRNGLTPRIVVVDRSDDASALWSDRVHEIALPPQTCAVTPGANFALNTSTVRFSVSSPLTPDVVYDYDMATRQLMERHTTKLTGGGGLDVSRYACSQLSTSSGVPLTVVHRKRGSPKRSPCLVYAYGAYGHSLTPEFRSSHVALLERGWSIAYAHVRGGGELGAAWHEDGKGLRKRHSFEDLIAACQHLGASGYTSPALLAGHGTSAGGLTFGAALNEHPGLLRAVVLAYPFLNPLRAMMDPGLPLTITEYEEWGNPAADSEVFRYMAAYDPYVNLKPAAYPAVLLRTSSKDIRVPAWMPLKYLARLRALRTDSRVSLIRILSDVAHGGEPLHSQEERALEYAFLVSQIEPS